MLHATNQFASVSKTWGTVQIAASRPVDGGYAINTHTATGGTRHDQLSFTTSDRDVYRLAYRVIAEGGLAGAHPDDIHAGLQARLRFEFTRALDTRRHAYADAIEALLDALDVPAQRAADAAALDDIAATLRPARTGHPEPTTTRDGRPLSGWGQLRAAYARTHGSAA